MIRIKDNYWSVSFYMGLETNRAKVTPAQPQKLFIKILNGAEAPSRREGEEFSVTTMI